jgi:DNA-binding NarL/FixJ family response regulator
LSIEIIKLKTSIVELQKKLEKSNSEKAAAILVAKQDATKAEEEGVGMLLSKEFTNREKEITNLISLGLTNDEISKKLSTFEPIVKTYLRNIYSKSDIHDRANLAICVLNSDKD